MNKFEIRYHNWANLKPVKFVFITVLWSLVFSIPIGIVFEIINIPDSAIGGPDFKKFGPIEITFIAVVLAPILETAIFQALPILLIQKFIKWKTNLLALLISSLLFSLAHLEYSIWYSVLITPIALLLAQAYIVFQTRPGSGFWITCSVHACRNFLALTIFFLSDL